MSQNNTSAEDPSNFGPNVPAHSAAVRSSRRQKEQFPDDFDERAKANSQQVTKIHEFRRDNIRDYEDPEKDYFEYDPSEKKRYDALKIETLFKFQTTYKAIKWGVAVGTCFAFHRYFRTRDLNAAAHWFTVMSFFGFFNVWISYGIQEFVTEYGSRKSLSLAARNEYHTNAYKTYLEGLETSVRPLDDKITPVLHNSQAQALNEFFGNFQNYLQDRFGTKDIIKDSMLPELIQQAEKQPDQLTQAQMMQLQMLKKDKYGRELAREAMDTEGLQKFADQILSRIDNVDLKSYSFEKDPDYTFRSGV